MKPEIEHKLDAVFSLYIRTKFSDSNGYCRCYICGTPYHIYEIDNGHCFVRRNRGTRWNENNCRPQCHECNRFEDTTGLFKDKLRDELGKELFEEIERLSRAIIKFSDREGLEMIEFYRNKLKEL